MGSATGVQKRGLWNMYEKVEVEMGFEGPINGGGEWKAIPGSGNGMSKGMVAGKSSTCSKRCPTGWRLGKYRGV